MKKSLSLLLILSLLTLTACGKNSGIWKPTVASADVKPYGEQAVKIIDQYLNFEIDAEKADEDFSSLSQRMIGMKIEDEESKYNTADKIIYELIENYGDWGVKYKSDIRLRQALDILAVQLGKKPSGETFDLTEFSNAEDEYGLDQFINTDESPVVIASVLENEGDYSLILSFDAMYGTSASDVQACIKTAFNNANTRGLSLTSIWASYRYYDQDVFTVSIRAYNSNLKGSVFLDSPENILGEFNNEEEMDAVLKEAAKLVRIK